MTRVADSRRARRVFHNSMHPSTQSRLGKPPEQCTTFADAIDAARCRFGRSSEVVLHKPRNEAAQIAEDRRSPTASLRSCSPQRARPQTPSGSPLPHAMAQRMQPVAQGLWSNIPPEKEYDFGEDDCCCLRLLLERRRDAETQAVRARHRVGDHVPMSLADSCCCLHCVFLSY